MGKKLKSVSLIGLGMVAGVAASVQYSALAQKGGDTPLPLDELRQLADVYALIKSDYVEKVDDKKLLSDAIAGMVSSLDPHSVYLDERDFAEMQEEVQGHFVGLGIEVAMEDGYVKIVSPLDDSPAYRAGIKAGIVGQAAAHQRGKRRLDYFRIRLAVHCVNNGFAVREPARLHAQRVVGSNPFYILTVNIAGINILYAASGFRAEDHPRRTDAVYLESLLQQRVNRGFRGASVRTGNSYRVG